VAELQARVGTLVRTRHLHRARGRRARELALAAEVGAMLTRGLDSAAQLCASAIGRHLDAALVGIWTADDEGRLALAAHFGTIDAAHIAPPKQGGDVRERFVHFDADTDTLLDDQGWRTARTRTFVEVPLIVDARVVGALAIGARRTLEPEEIQAIAPLADLVALGFERMRAERERGALLVREQRARAEAEAANRSKDEFLAVLSHELRGPLSAIAGWVHLLRSGEVPPSGTERALATIERNTRSQTQLVEDLLDVSRIVSGKAHHRRRARRPGPDGRRGRRVDATHRRREEGRAAGRGRARRRRARGPDPAPAGGDEPPDQRAEVHARGRQGHRHLVDAVARLGGRARRA
jgi:signal transduction histidine kinase